MGIRDIGISTKFFESGLKTDTVPKLKSNFSKSFLSLRLLLNISMIPRKISPKKIKFIVSPEANSFGGLL